MMIRKRGMFAFILMTVLVGITAAQTPAPAPAPATVPDTVYVLATVTGPKKAPAPGLKAENFQLFEDGVEQKITSFSAADGLWDINIILASSTLIAGPADRTYISVHEAVDTFKKTSNPGAKVKIDELKFGSDGLFAAIDRNLVDLQQSRNPRKALIVITDGFDRHFTSAAPGFSGDANEKTGGEAANKLIEFTKRLSIPIYFMYSDTGGIDAPHTNLELSGRGGQPAAGTPRDLADKDALTTVADQTGGAFTTGNQLTQLEPQLKLLAEELRNKYVLGFKSTNDKQDDKWRKLKVTLKAPSGPKLDIAVKSKYFVSKPTK